MTCSNTRGHGNWPQQSKSYPLKNYNFQPSELLVLELLRHYCQSYAVPNSYAWEKAFALGERELGPYDGAWVVSATAAFIQTIRSERKASFEFIVSCCDVCQQQICITELNALWMVQAAREENAIAIETAGRLTLDRAGFWPGLDLLIARAKHLGSVLREVFPEERHHRFEQTVTRFPKHYH